MFDKKKISALPVLPCEARSGPSALDGVRVVDFTHFLAGPLATQMLADFGAEVIKIEPPGKGEDFRFYPPHDSEMGPKGGGAPFLWANRNKKSIALDIKSSVGLEVVKDLIRSSDVLVENFSSGVMERFGLNYEFCSKLNPRLIYCSISAYGRQGPFSDRSGLDAVVQAESGFMSMNGYQDRPGVRSGPVVMDIATSMMAGNAILLALFARERTNNGQKVEISLFDTAMTMTGFATMQHLTSGVEAQRHANTSPDTCPTGVFATADREVYIACGNDKIFQRLFTKVINRPDIANNVEFSSNAKRGVHRDFIFSVISEQFALHPWAYWSRKLRDAAIPSGLVRTLSEALASDEARERNLVGRIEHPLIDWVPNIASPLRLADTPAVAPRAAPFLGQHTFEILSQTLGYDQERIGKIDASGACGKLQDLMS
ncbi:carnitine dehydratase [Bradyrhizobium sp. UNPF46]|uniref:CaiB/BaiF CoA transferase family protein n=1 Tax=Bradyrhizobium sp. UNPF46 TaxID=1141168 RepID=UPI001150082C|nr:CoA transferase [Bradyrhizobium sp. UNPF46]TQF27575.1 carnitine dehydratase [Bradyrhizobium sp. UNPF46]